METSHEQLQAASPGKVSPRTMRILAILAVILFAGIFMLGYLPRRTRNNTITSEAKHEESALPEATVVKVKRSAKTSELSLPGNMQAIIESPILARADGYVVKRNVDIGDKLKKDQFMAEIYAPDLDQQVKQARATLQQSHAALAQSEASLEQAKANASLAEVTAQRNRTLVGRGVLSKQEGDTSDANYLAQAATVRAMEANVGAARQSEDAVRANLNRLLELQGYKIVRAPFAGVVTQRNIDTGYYISAGSTMLFRLAQYDILRTFINVPQANYESLRVGEKAQVSITELPGRVFDGMITRLSGALDTATRTLLTEVQIKNPTGILRPGMISQVHFSFNRSQPPVTIPGEALYQDAGGSQVAVMDGNQTIHIQKVSIGRDLGRDVEIINGVEPGAMVVLNPNDDVREGVKVKPRPIKDPEKDATVPGAAPAAAGGKAGQSESPEGTPKK